MIEQRNEKNDAAEENDHREIFSKAVRAGKRTYFFDVKSTRRNDYFLTISESKKRFNKDGHYFFEKHKIFLYKEDFEKFSEGFGEVMGFLINYDPNEEPVNQVADNESVSVGDYTHVDFDDLESVEIAGKQSKN
jgi:hypothetical protein